MSPHLFALILAARFMVASLAPLTDERAEMADAIAWEVYDDAPFYRDDAGKLRTLALHIAVAYREGGVQTSAIGDSGHSFCAFQIHDSSGGTRALASDAAACAHAGHVMLRQSIRICRAHPIAWYAEGPRGCSSERAQRISRDRVALAETLARPYPDSIRLSP
jgi:hypothetical protein